MFNIELLKLARVEVSDSQLDTTDLMADVRRECYSKTIQVNRTDTYIIGGRTNKEFLKVCFRVNLTNS